MNYKKPIIIFFFASLVLLGGYFIYQFFFKKEKEHLFTTQQIGRRTITQVVKATGNIDVEDMMKIGSIITGIIRKMHVEENDFVKKGDLLAEIKDGREDTEVKEAHALLERAKADLVYVEKFFIRQEILYSKNHISTDAFDQATRDFEIAKAEVQFRQASLEKAQLLHSNEIIIAPDDGMVIDKIASEGETVTLSSPPTILYTIAKDITKMEAELEIDESTVGIVKKNMTAILTFDTYPHRIFKGPIIEISNAPKKQNGAVTYIATVPIDNKELLFRPGMTVDSRITIEEKQDVIAVPGYIFNMNEKILHDISKIENFEFVPIDIKEKRALSEQDNIKTIWIYKNKSFIERSVEVGINDNAFFEIVQGLEDDEEIIIDTIEPDVMEEFYERFFGKGLLERE